MTIQDAGAGEGAGAVAPEGAGTRAPSSQTPPSPLPELDARKEALRLAGIYAVFATVWIVVSDYVARHSAATSDDLMEYSVLKGLAFVAVTAALLFGLAMRLMHRIRESMQRARSRDAEIARLSRLYAALAEINRAILWSRSREALYAEVCRALVEQGGIRMAWIGHEAPDAKQLEALAAHGQGSDLPAAVTFATLPSQLGDSAAGEAFQRGRPSIRNHVLEDLRSAPWRDAFRERGFAAAAAFPIRDGSEVAAVLAVYTAAPSFFHDLEIELLQRVTTNITYAIDNFRREERRLAAEERAHAEREFTQLLLESMPGIIFLYDESRHVHRWNRQMERVTGYSAREIARMNVLDFFTPEGRASVDAAISQIFEGKDSNAMARLQAADGTVTRYRLVSRRVEMGGRAYIMGQGVEVVSETPEFSIQTAPAPASGEPSPS
ncbi:GAF domain-containing protein [Ramlibacter sp.]|uniref:GAF domain-containing protein n=1 Tax=Ramlibacter sp. TaxID=1917967 RepID=UPI0035B1CE66